MRFCFCFDSLINYMDMMMAVLVKSLDSGGSTLSLTVVKKKNTSSTLNMNIVKHRLKIMITC